MSLNTTYMDTINLNSLFYHETSPIKTESQICQKTPNKNSKIYPELENLDGTTSRHFAQFHVKNSVSCVSQAKPRHRLGWGVESHFTIMQNFISGSRIRLGTKRLEKIQAGKKINRKLRKSKEWAAMLKKQQSRPFTKNLVAEV